ncbi:MAG: DUF2283 domain-containing protein [bacterium]
MKIEYDAAADALYVTLKSSAKVSNTLASGPGVNVDVDARGNPVGIEVLYAVRRLGRSALTTLGVDLSGLDWSPIQDRLLSTAEAAKMLGVSRQYVAQLARRRKIAASRAGRGWLIHQSGLQRARPVAHKAVRDRPR